MEMRALNLHHPHPLVLQLKDEDAEFGNALAITGVIVVLLDESIATIDTRVDLLWIVLLEKFLKTLEMRHLGHCPDERVVLADKFDAVPRLNFEVELASRAGLALLLASTNELKGRAMLGEKG